MSKDILIRISGNALEISPDGKSSLQPRAREILEPQLRYVYRQLLRGQAAFDLHGHRRPIHQELRLMYVYDKYGRMVCGIGFLRRVTALLKTSGFEVTVIDVTPPHPRTDRFTPDWDSVINTFKFRARQEECLVSIASNERGIIAAPTGFGKTYFFPILGVLFPRARILVTTKRVAVATMLRNNLVKYLPNVGMIGGGERQNGRITVCTADSLHRLNHEDWDIVAVDEVHEYAAPTYSRELTRFSRCRMYGFSATPTGRMDGADVKLESIFGPVIFSMSYQEAVDCRMVVQIRVRWLDVVLDENPAANRKDTARQRWGIWRNDARNQTIAAAAREFDDNEQVLIMVTTFEHAVRLRQFLPEFTLCYAERDDQDIEDYKAKALLPADEPQMTVERREFLRKEFEAGRLKKVIATDVWSTGVSFDQLSVLIRADARASEIMDAQIPGRVCRLHTDKTEGLVIDCLDQFDSSFRDAARKRRRNYESKGWTQDMPNVGRNVIPQ